MIKKIIIGAVLSVFLITSQAHAGFFGDLVSGVKLRLGANALDATKMEALPTPAPIVTSYVDWGDGDCTADISQSGYEQWGTIIQYTNPDGTTEPACYINGINYFNFTVPNTPQKPTAVSDIKRVAPVAAISTPTAIPTVKVQPVSTNNADILKALSGMKNASVSSDTASEILRSLSRGATGSDVMTIQEKLRLLGFLSGNADGKYGPATEDAIRRFQASRGLTADGKAGAKTIASLDVNIRSVGSTSSGASLGSTGGTTSPSLCNSVAPSIRVISPNGGETFTAGGPITIKWNKCNMTEDVYIQLYRTSGSGQTPINLGQTQNDGQQGYTIPSTASGQYRVRILAMSNWNGANQNAPVDDSDNSFTINNNLSGLLVSYANSSVTVATGPNGGDDIGTFKVKFKVTNNTNGDVYLDRTCLQDPVTGVGSLFYIYQTSSGMISIPNSTCSYISTSGADQTQTSFLVAEGDSEIFELSTVADPVFAGLYRMKINRIGYNIVDGEGNQVVQGSMLDNLKTAYIYLD